MPDFNEKDLEEKKGKKKKENFKPKFKDIVKKSMAAQPNGTAMFIKIPVDFFRTTLVNLHDGPGWILNFNDDELVFKKVEIANVPSDLIKINPNDYDPNNPNLNHGISYVDVNLQHSNNTHEISDVFSFYGANFQDSNWDTMPNKADVPFFYIDKGSINSMYPDGNFYFLSPEIFTISNSALNSAPDIYDLIKIECVHIPTTPDLVQADDPDSITEIYGSDIKAHPVQAKVIFALPCPPEWNPAFVGIWAFKQIQSQP